MTKPWKNRQRGTNLIELTIGIGVASFVFAALGALTWVTAANLLNVHDQMQSQQGAAAALDRVCAVFRTSDHFAVYTGDDASQPLTRIKVLVPGDGNGPGKWGAIAYSVSKRQIVWFSDESKLTWDGVEPQYDATSKTNHPDAVFREIGGLQIWFNSDFWLTVRVNYDYRGFGLRFRQPAIQQSGVFVTDVRAKNFNIFGT